MAACHCHAINSKLKTMKLFNSLSRKTEDFAPINGREARIYSCGPTVYNFAHIGNMRAFLFADILQRVIRIVGGYEVRWVMNITNIDDKTIRDSALGSAEWKHEMGEQSDDAMTNLINLTAYYEKEFCEDIQKLNINLSHFSSLPRATDYIETMHALIKRIYDNGFAYISDGSIYFDVAKYRKYEVYGKLHKIDFDKFMAGTRIDADQYGRDEACDFALWKARKADEPYWEFTLDGKRCDGRPGWHLECSAMEYELLGLPFDIHTGGIDLKFPHHEDEIAQSKAGYGIEPTAFWCHNEFLEVEGEKMSKSKGNYFTLRDLIDRNIDPLDIRYSMLSSHYASVYNFTFDDIKSGRKGRKRVQDYIYSLFDGAEGEDEADIFELKYMIFDALGNDLHTPKALAHLFTFINNNKVGSLSSHAKKELLDMFKEINDIFDVWQISPRPESENDIPGSIIKKAEQRLVAKRAKNWALADALREEISKAGYAVKDTKDSYTIEMK